MYKVCTVSNAIHRRIVGYQILQRIFWKTKKLFPSLNFHARFLHTLIDAHVMYGRRIKKILNLPADLWKIHFFIPSWTFKHFSRNVQSLSIKPRTRPPVPPTNKKQPKPTQQHPAQHHTAHTNPMAITTTSASRGVNPPQRTAANDDQEHATSTQHPKESKRKADADDENVETLHQKGASVDDNKNTKSPPNRSKRKKSNDNAKTANDTEALHAASKDNSEIQQPTKKSKGKDNSQQTSKSNESGTLESSSNHNQSSTQGLTTPVKGTTVSKHGFSTLEKPVFFLL